MITFLRSLKSSTLYIGTIVILVLWGIIATRSCTDNKRLYKSEKAASTIAQDSFATNLKVWKDKYGDEHSKVDQHLLEKKVFEEYADSAANVLNLKSKQIEDLTQINTRLQLQIKGFKKDSTIVYIPIRDTSGKIIDSIAQVDQINFKWNRDSWISISGTVGKVDSINVNGTDSLLIAEYWKRSWALGPKSYYTDVTNKNPYIHISGIRSVKPIVRDPQWLLAPSITIGWNGSAIIVPGVSLIYYPLSIKIK